eukprot:2619279-Prymnesium_polylepis.1
MCMLGSDFQKYTTLMFSPGLSPSLSRLNQHRCVHSSHSRQAGGFEGKDGRWISASAAAYPPEFSSLIARMLRDIRFDTSIRDVGPLGHERPHERVDLADPSRSMIRDIEGEPTPAPPPTSGAIASAPPAPPAAVVSADADMGDWAEVGTDENPRDD